MQTPTLWPSLPTTLEHSLLLSSEGEKLLVAFAESLLEAGENELAPELFPTFSGFLLSAWESSLLSAKTAGMLLTAHEILPCLNELSADFCSTCASLKPSNPAFAQQINTAIANGDLEDAKNLTIRFATQEPGNLFWLRFAQHIGLLWGELDWYEPWLENPRMPRAFARIFRADYAFARKDWQTAVICMLWPTRQPRLFNGWCARANAICAWATARPQLNVGAERLLPAHGRQICCCAWPA